MGDVRVERRRYLHFGAGALALAAVIHGRAAAQSAPPDKAPPLPTPAAATAQSPEPAEKPQFLRYARAGASGAKARNVYDPQGLLVLDVAPGTLLAVHGERSGWLEVEAPGGFPVWVFGEYVTPSSEAGWIAITGDGVRLRPIASAGTESLPLRPAPAKGARARLIGRKDMSKPLAEDWINVWSPPGTRAYVLASETEPLKAGEDGAALWAQAILAARPAAPVVPAAAPKSADDAKPETQDVRDALAKAESALDVARQRELAGAVPDYASVRAQYEAVLALAPTGPSAEVARGRIDLCTGYAEAYRLRVELEQERAAVDAALRKRQAEIDRAARRGALDGRFDSRGWLERVSVAGASEPIWLVRFAGSAEAEIVCTTGRYDLAFFEGCEVGVNGRQIRGSVAGAAGDARPRELDVERIEIIAARPAKP